MMKYNKTRSMIMQCILLMGISTPSMAADPVLVDPPAQVKPV